jgi:hypothetical protein
MRGVAVVARCLHHGDHSKWRCTLYMPRTVVHGQLEPINILANKGTVRSTEEKPQGLSMLGPL